MPRLYHMTYVPSQGRWTKMNKGQRFYISTQQLGTDATKEASWRAANAWWAQKASELGIIQQSGSGAVVDAFLTAWAGRKVERDEKPAIMSELLNHVVCNYDAKDQSYFFLRLLGQEKYDRLLASTEQRDNSNQSIDAILQGEPCLDNSLEGHAKTFYMVLQTKVSQGNLSASSYDNYCRELKHFVDHLGRFFIVKNLDEETWQKWTLHIANSECSKASKKHRIDVSKMFLQYLWRQKLIELPRNLNEMKFRQPEGQKITWTLEEFRQSYEETTGIKRLYLLLAANCGWYASDMADMGDIDFTGGYVEKSRKKTGAVKVQWFLWDETIDLVKLHHAELKDCWSKELVDGKVKKVNKTRGSWVKPLKQLRHTSITMLKNSHLAPWADYFAGHTNKTMVERHYANTNDAIAKQIANFLHDQYFA